MAILYVYTSTPIHCNTHVNYCVSMLHFTQETMLTIDEEDAVVGPLVLRIVYGTGECP